MKTVCFTIQRPPHVHFFRNTIGELEAAGHETHVFVRDSEITTDLLDAYGIEYAVLAESANGSLSRLAASQAAFEARLVRRLREVRPDVVAGVGGMSAAHAATAVGARGVAFTDTEHATLTLKLMVPFADAVHTPECFHRDLGDKHVRYPGYHELAYLHPDRFDPDPAVLDAAGVDPDEPLAVVRLGGWDAFHDVGASGIGDAADVVDRLEDAGAQVRLTSEVPLSSDLHDRKLDLPPERIHDLLAHATLYLGEGATMAAESAVLGTPALYVNTLRMGYTDELEARYGLVENFQGTYRHERAVRSAERILNGDARVDYEVKRAELLADKTDTTPAILRALGVDEGEP